MGRGRATWKKRIIQQRGVGKHKILPKAIDQQKKDTSTLLGISKSSYSHCGAKCFDFLFHGCVIFHVVPFRRTPSGKYVPLDWKQKIAHYAVLSLWIVLTVQKPFVILRMLLHEELRIETFICVSLFVIHFVAFMISLGTLARPQETIEVLNSHPGVLSCIQEIRHGKPRLNPFHDISASLQVVAAVLVAQGIAFAASIASLIWSDLPACFFPMAESVGLIPAGALPRFAWQLMSFPVEYLAYLPAMFIAPLSGGILMTELGVLKLYLQELRYGSIFAPGGTFGAVIAKVIAHCCSLCILYRKYDITDMEGRAVVERLYNCLQCHFRVYRIWVKFHFPPHVLSISVAVIITTFVSIRYTDLPLILYIFYPNTAFNLMLIIFWLCYDTVRVVRASEEIIDRLQSQSADYLRPLPRAMRMHVLKRARAMKEIEYPVGEFSELTLNLPIAMWEEILNQVLFLLSF